jgi:subtilisin family serine protease
LVTLGLVMSARERDRRVVLVVAGLCVAACAGRRPAVEPPRRECLSSAELLRVAARARAPKERRVMSKLDLTLTMLVEDLDQAAQQEARRAGVAAATGPGEAAARCIPAKTDVTVWYTGSLDDLRAAGLQVSHRDRDDRGIWIASGQIATSQLTVLEAIEHVTAIAGPEVLSPELSDSVPAIGVKALRQAHPDATGTGVVVGIIDAGFDWRHGGFRDNATGRTRITAIWDLTLPADERRVGEISFAARDIFDPTKRLDPRGVYYDRDDIDFSLGFQVTKQGPVKVRTTDPPKPYDPKNPDLSSGHGTHVAGIAAGDGSTRPCCRPWGAGRYEGVAPGADIILVRGGTSVVRHALAFIDEIAGSRPAVVNLSQGLNAGPHDGTNVDERAIDRFVTTPGRVFVKSAGNEGNTKKHGVATVPAQQPGAPPAPGEAELDVIIPADMKSMDSLEIWYEAPASLDVQVAVKSDGLVSAWLGIQGMLNFAINRDQPPMQVVMRTVPDEPRNHDRLIDVRLPRYPRQAPLTVTLRLRNAGAAAVVVNAWIAKGTNGVTFVSPERDGTLTIPGTALGAIVVGNHTLGSSTCDSGGDIHETSSRGPVRKVPSDPDQARPFAKPTLAAPGTDITSASANAGCCCGPDWLANHYRDMSGTSMAAPHVAGTIALMLQKNPALTAAQVRDILVTSATPVGGPVTAWGAGKLDARRAWEAVSAPAPSPLRAAARAPAPRQPSMLHPIVRVLRETMRRVPDGELCAALISRHFAEVRRLINRNPKVATMWHRADGPNLLRRIAAGTADADARTPLRDDRDRGYLVKMFEQLHRHGSPALRTTLDLHQALLLRVIAAPLAAQAALT